ncbi:hypothetical protein [Microbacterium sp. MYb62]|uniref:hypothetical protein n=1 Tax=Microbacterium sp. MYb62 TaxID=1848690 RepID=UPI000CFDE14F|nr:hypothetical protein [Microbacterium sp. MYb62]PRB14457.1 hypothetical protein CQ042_11090 [Microbacterium sp. MYb62]
MALVTFKLNTYAMAKMTGYFPRLRFQPTTVSTLTGGGNSYLFPTQSISVVIAADNESCSANLAPSSWTRPNVLYRLIIEWLDAAGNFSYQDVLPWLLFVPPAGGTLDELLALPSNPYQAYIGDVPPNEWTPPIPTIPGTWWLDSDPESPTFGHLHEWE